MATIYDVTFTTKQGKIEKARVSYSHYRKIFAVDASTKTPVARLVDFRDTYGMQWRVDLSDIAFVTGVETVDDVE